MDSLSLDLLRRIVAAKTAGADDPVLTPKDQVSHSVCVLHPVLLTVQLLATGLLNQACIPEHESGLGTANRPLMHVYP